MVAVTMVIGKMIISVMIVMVLALILVLVKMGWSS